MKWKYHARTFRAENCYKRDAYSLSYKINLRDNSSNESNVYWQNYASRISTNKLLYLLDHVKKVMWLLETLCGSKYSRIDHIISNFLKVVFHKFYLVYS